MSADILPFKKPEPFLVACRNCGTMFHPRDNGRAGFCSYGCGQEGQRQYVAATLRGGREPQEV